MTSTQRAIGSLLLSLASMTLVSCGGDSGGSQTVFTPVGGVGGGGGGGGGTTPVFLGNVAGTAVSANSGTPINGASISANSLSTTSRADGRYGLNLGNAARTVLRAQASGHAENFRVFAVAGLPVIVPTPLAPLGGASAYTIAGGGTLALPGTVAQVTLPINALAPPAGVTASPTVTFAITVLNPVTNLNTLPGDYTTVDNMGNPQSIESFGAINFYAEDAGGVRYTMAGASTAVIRIPAVTRAAPLPATISLMYFNETNGRWIAEGTATLGGVAPNQYYEGTVARLGFWTAARPLDAVTLTGCVRDPTNQPVANARIILEGVDYSGASYALSDATGAFSMPLQRNRAATLTAQAGGALSNTIAVAASAANVTTPCLQTTGSVNGLSIRLTWGASPSDIDSHLYLPNGQHVYYASRGALAAAPYYAALDVDDVTGFGPEVVTITRLYTGTYRYALHNFSGTFSPGMTGSGTRLELTWAGFTTTFAPPSGEGTNRYWNVFELVVDNNCQASIRVINTWATAPTTTPVATPTLCP